MKFIVKLSPEITIKTRPVRKQFSGRLQANIRRVLKRNGIGSDVALRWDMLEIETESASQGEALAELLQRIPGIAHFLQVDEHPLALQEYSNDDLLHNIYLCVAETVGNQLDGKTFVVRCKRSGKHPFTSHEVERYVGGGLNQHTAAAGVQMRGADVTVNLEIKQNRLFVVKQRYTGMGGYPIGCVAPVLSLISGGYDSSVASYDAIRRGMETHFCFFNLGGHAHEVGVKQVSHYLWDQYAASHRTSFVSVPFEQVVEEILSTVRNAYMGVVLKRMMYRAATAIADAMHIDALLTGESVSQVSSQTIRNLSVIDSVTDKLVLRPLATWDKTAIIHLASDIGVAGYAERIPEYCAVISDKPTTAAKMDIVLQEEKNFDFAVLDAAIAQRELVGMDRIYQYDKVLEEVEVQSIPQPEQVVVDLRHSDEQERKPLVLHGNETVNIPFYKINRVFSTLDQNRNYLLYCDRGVMSKLHAVHLKAEGFNNVKVYQPAGDAAGPA